jgi:hypothetical protein
MSDDIDRASEREQMDRDRAIAATRARSLQARPMPGKCVWCDSVTPGVFCDTDCRDDYQRAERGRGVRL